MNNYEKERMKLWREVYVQELRTSSISTAKAEADSAVDWFDKKFGGEQ